MGRSKEEKRAANREAHKRYYSDPIKQALHRQINRDLYWRKKLGVTVKTDRQLDKEAAECLCKDEIRSRVR